MNPTQRISLAQKSLQGLSIGDAFGESFFGETDVVLAHIQARSIPQTSWEFTDDTVMAIAVYEQLLRNHEIDQNQLAHAFVRNHDLDVNRGYGATVRRILREISEEGDWRELAPQAFDGMGSMGNGAAMRVSPIGAFFYDDWAKVKEQATKSAEITHANAEGITGAIAVALATALTTESGLTEIKIAPNDFIDQIIAHLPDTDTASKIKKATRIPYTYHIDTVRSILGNGSKIMAQDTVPFVIWCAAHNLGNFAEALWKAVSILGDRDTICAMVGGITIMSSPEKDIPVTWQTLVEDFEKSPFWKDV